MTATLLSLGDHVFDVGQLESHAAGGGILSLLFRNGDVIVIDFQDSRMAEQAVLQIGAALKAV